MVPPWPSQGVLSIIGKTKRVIVQGVYELFEKEPSTEWGDEERVNRLVFIGNFFLLVLKLMSSDLFYFQDTI